MRRGAREEDTVVVWFGRGEERGEKATAGLRGGRGKCENAEDTEGACGGRERFHGCWRYVKDREVGAAIHAINWGENMPCQRDRGIFGANYTVT